MIVRKDAIVVRTYFTNPNHIFQRDEKLIRIEQITKKYSTIEELRFIAKKREMFWILNPGTLYPEGLNQELNDVL